MRVIKKENDVYLQFEETREIYLYLLAILAIGLSVFIHAARPPDDWVFSQWLITYEWQFLKRGLMGELFRQTGIPLSYMTVFFASLFFMFTLVTVLSVKTGALLIRDKWTTWLDQQWSVGGILFVLFFLFHSSTLQHIARNTGRFEQIQLILVLCFLYLIQRFYSKQQSAHGSLWGRYGITILLFLLVAIVSTLIHEAFFFFYLPLMFGFWIAVFPGNLILNLIRLALFGIMTLFTWFVSTYGLLPIPAYESFIEYMQSKHGLRADPSSLVVVFRDFNTNVEYTSYWVFQKWMYIHIGVFLLVMSPTFWLIGKIFAIDFKNLKTDSHSRLRLFAFFTCLSPLGLVFLGFDLFRWFSICILNIFLLCTLFMHDKEYKSIIFDLFWRHRLVVGTIIILSFIFGPVGVVSSFRIGNRINELLGF